LAAVHAERIGVEVTSRKLDVDTGQRRPRWSSRDGAGDPAAVLSDCVDAAVVAPSATTTGSANDREKWLFHHSDAKLL